MKCALDRESLISDDPGLVNIPYIPAPKLSKKKGKKNHK